MLTDSHADLDLARFADDRAAILKNAWEAGVRTILTIGIGDGPDTMHRALDISRELAGRPDTPKIYTSAGIHPHEAALADDTAFAKLDSLLQEPEVIAAGEIGLDYYYDHSPRETQKAVFRQQMDIAATRKKPIIIHCRPSDNSTNAWDDTLALLEAHWASTGLGGILHCFTGVWEHARRAIDAGFMISFAGNITFPKAQPIRDAAERVPLDRILIETDAPFLAPVPNRGRRNEPAWVAQVAPQIGTLRGIEPADVAEKTSWNFHRFFNIG